MKQRDVILTVTSDFGGDDYGLRCGAPALLCFGADPEDVGRLRAQARGCELASVWAHHHCRELVWVSGIQPISHLISWNREGWKMCYWAVVVYGHLPASLLFCLSLALSLSHILSLSQSVSLSLCLSFSVVFLCLFLGYQQNRSFFSTLFY